MRQLELSTQSSRWFGRSTNRRDLLPLALLFSQLLLVAFFSPDGHAESVSIAIAGPMTGTSSTVGVQYRVGVEAAVSGLPQGRLLGVEVKLRTFDDGCKAAIAEAVAHQIASERHQVIIGHSCSAASIAGAPIYATANILQITPASTSPRVTEMGITSLFRMIGRDDFQGQIAAERLANEYGDQRIGIVRFPGAYSRGLTDIAIAGLASRGIQPAIVIEGAVSSSSYVSLIEELIRSGVDIVYLVGGGLDSAVFLRQCGQLEAPFTIISADTLVSRIFIETAGAFGENVPFTFPPDATSLSTAADARELIRSQGNDPAGYTLLAFAATEVWIEGVRRAGSFDASQVAAAIRERPIKTVLGKVSFDNKGDILTEYPPFEWFVWRNGKRVPLQ